MRCSPFVFRASIAATWALVAALPGLLPALFPTGAAAWCRTTTKTPLTGVECVQEGLPLRWERQCLSFTVEDTDELEPPLELVRDAADRSFAAWTEIDCGGQRIGIDVHQTADLGQCTVAEYSSDAPNMNAILFVNDWNDHAELPPDAFAVTLVWNLVETGEIVDADMLLNPNLGRLTICNGQCEDRANDVDLQNVITHEAGHFLGLAHSAISDATMSATAPVGETLKRDLTDDDRDGLCSIYADQPPAQCASRDYVPRHGFSPLCSPPSVKEDCAVRQPRGSAPPGLSAAWLVLAAALLWMRRAR